MIETEVSRQIVFDTETTGMNENGPVYIGHRIIEIGCVELVNRKPTGRTFHVFINPDQAIDEDAIKVHGITNERVANEPRFAQVANDFLDFVRGAELIAHNAGFDISFIDHELSMLPGHLTGIAKVTEICSVTDSLKVARQGQYLGRTLQLVQNKPFPSRKNLDALCAYYGIDTSSRTYHGALLDAELLADVFLAMTGGQNSLNLGAEDDGDGADAGAIRRLDSQRPPLVVISATQNELEKHQETLDLVDKKSGSCIWRAEKSLH